MVLPHLHAAERQLGRPRHPATGSPNLSGNFRALARRSAAKKADRVWLEPKKCIAGMSRSWRRGRPLSSFRASLWPLPVSYGLLLYQFGRGAELGQRILSLRTACHASAPHIVSYFGGTKAVPQTGKSKSALRVLLVEDNAVIGMLLVGMLEDMGHDVCAVEGDRGRRCHRSRSIQARFDDRRCAVG